MGTSPFISLTDKISYPKNMVHTVDTFGAAVNASNNHALKYDYLKKHTKSNTSQFNCFNKKANNIQC